MRLLDWWDHLPDYKREFWGAFAGVMVATTLGLALVLLASHAFAAEPVRAAARPPAPRIVIPEHSARYRMAIERESGAVFGLTASPARIAAQIHQESRFNPAAKSPYAAGLAQFTPATAGWMAKVFPDECGEADPWDENWAIRCAVRYDRYLITRVQPTASDCDSWAFTLAAYNGGLGWVKRDRHKAGASGADTLYWFGNVELHSARADWARAENRAYVRRILTVLEHAYIDAGWPGDAVCARSV